MNSEYGLGGLELSHGKARQVQRHFSFSQCHVVSLVYFYIWHEMQENGKNDMDMESRHVRDKSSGPGATFAEGFCKQVGDLKTP